MGELIVNGIKIAFTLAIAFVFMSAISAFLSLIETIILGDIVGEFFGLISCFLPFSASAVFGSILTALNAILSFMVAQKIYDLTSDRVQL